MVTNAKPKGYNIRTWEDQGPWKSIQSKPIVTVSDTMDIDHTEPETEPQTGVYTEDRMNIYIYISPMGILTHLQVYMKVHGAIQLCKWDIEPTRNGDFDIYETFKTHEKRLKVTWLFYTKTLMTSRS